MTFKRTCPLCKKEHSFAVYITEAQALAWEHGVPLWLCMPEVTHDIRHKIETGVCDRCDEGALELEARVYDDE